MDVQKTRDPIIANKDRILGERAKQGTEAKLRLFLEAYARNGRIMKACKMAGIAFTVHYRRLQSDAVYRAAFEEAEQQAAQHIEDRVYGMAIDGELQASLALLRRFRPAQYRERASLEVSGSVNLVERLQAARKRLVAMQHVPPSGTAG